MMTMADMLTITGAAMDRSAYVRRLTDRAGFCGASLPAAVLRPVIPGVVAAARELGVSRQHLHAVLNGRRFSPGLVDRYRRMRGAA